MECLFMPKSWIWCLWKTQGSYRSVLESGHLIDAGDYDDWEYKYILDLDKETFSCECEEGVVEYYLSNLPNEICYESDV